MLEVSGMCVPSGGVWEELDTHLELRTKVKRGYRFGSHSHSEGYMDAVNQGGLEGVEKRDQTKPWGS